MKEKTASWLDSSALLALLYGEAGMIIVRDLLVEAEEGKTVVYFSGLSLTEVISSLSKTHGESVARDELQVVLSMPAQIESPTRGQCAEAGWLRGRYRLSTADAIIAVQAMAANTELVHKDPEFEAVPGLKQRQLPYKKSERR
ncbi:MAG: type II toxin-antitoxin system VapC family toxin [Chthoniobacterales bacterium]